MARVLEIEARPPSLIRLWIPTSRTAAALAASIAVVAVGIGIRQAQLQTGFPSSDPIVRASATVAAQPRRDATRGSLSLVSTYPGARPTAFFGRGVPEPALQGFATVTPDQHLDAQLNELQLDPQAFFRRLERVQDRERFIQRLAERAARRGDAAQVGLRVRSVQHRLAPPMGEQFLQASLVQQVSAHR